MAKIKDNQLLITDDNGNEFNVDILFTYTNDETNKSYVFFIDLNDDESVISMRYIEETGELIELEDEEYDEAEEVFNAYQDDPKIQDLKNN